MKDLELKQQSDQVKALEAIKSSEEEFQSGESHILSSLSQLSLGTDN